MLYLSIFLITFILSILWVNAIDNCPDEKDEFP